MVRGLALLVGAALAQNHRPWNRLGQQLALRTNAGPVPVALAQEGPVPNMVTATSQEGPVPLSAPQEGTVPVSPQEGPVPLMQAMSSSSVGRIDANGCVLGSGYQWCAAKSKCLREWEEPCEAPSTTECGEGEVICTVSLQRQGQNCVVGTCFKAPSAPRLTLGAARDLHGCESGAGFSWCNNKQKCLRQWEEPCEETVAAPAGGAQDEHGCTLGGGFRWCENKQKCLREWEEACEEGTPKTPLNLIRNIVNKHVSPEQQEAMMTAQRAKVKKVLAELKEKQVQLKGMVQQKMAAIEENDTFTNNFGVMLNARIRALADSFGRPVREAKAPAIADEVL